MSTPIHKKAWFLSVVLAVAITTAVFWLNKPFYLNKNLKNTEDESLALSSFYKQEEAKPCVAPPLSGLNIPYTNYEVDAGKGGEFTFNTGSVFIVPENAFVDQSGVGLQGTVELRYREFHDAVDFFVAGIPMTYDSAGVRYQFESAGMMEMQAYQNGKQVFMAPGKSVEIQLASKHSSTEHNLYKLDTVKNNWACLGKDRVVHDAPLSPQQVEAELKTIEKQKLESVKEKTTKIESLAKVKNQPEAPLKADKNKYAFNIDVEPKEFPELAVFKNVLFEVGQENLNFNKSMYDITWDEVTIKDGKEKGKNYVLTLRKGRQSNDIVVYPVLEGKNYEKAQAEYNEKMKKYSLALEKRKFDERLIEMDYQQKVDKLKQQQKQVELKWKQVQDQELSHYDTEQKVKRMFVINSFGVYNCDKPIAYPTGISCVATLFDDKNEKVMCYEVYLVDKSINALFTFTKNPVKQFSYNPQSTNLVWTVHNDVLYWLNPTQFKDIVVSNGVADLVLTKVDKKFKTADELKAFFSL